MKFHKIIKLSPLLLGALTFSITAVATTQFAQAVTVEKTQKAEGSVSVFVPAGGASLSYELDGVTVEVAPGESAAIPAGATNISFPLNTVVSIKSTPVSRAVTFNVVRDVLVPVLDFASLSKHSTAFSHVPFPNVKHQGGGRPIQTFFNPATFRTGTDSNK